MSDGSWGPFPSHLLQKGSRRSSSTAASCGPLMICTCSDHRTPALALSFSQSSHIPGRGLPCVEMSVS